MPDRSSEIKQIFETMLSMFLEWDGPYKTGSVDRVLLRTEANSLYKIKKDIDSNLRARFILTAKGDDLDIIGEGMNRPRLQGETDGDYRKRLIINDVFFNDSTVQGIKNAIRGYYGIDVDNDGLDDTKIVEVYREALKGGEDFDEGAKYLGEEFNEGVIEVHLMMVQEGDEIIIGRSELFDKIYKTRAAGVLLYLIFHSNYEDNFRMKLQDKTSLVAKIKEETLGNVDGEVVLDDCRGIPILQRHDIFDVRTKGNVKEQDYDLLVGTDEGAAKIGYTDYDGTEDNDPGKRFEDDISHGQMESRRVHRLLDGEAFTLPKDFQIPLHLGQREEIVLFNHGENNVREVVRVEPSDSHDIRIRIDDGTTNLKATLQVVPEEFNGDDLVFSGVDISTDFIMTGKWSNINEGILIEDADIELDYDSILDEFETDGYYISPPIDLSSMTKFGMVKWIYNTGDVSVQIRTGVSDVYLDGLGDNDNWGVEYVDHNGEFVSETVDNFFQFRINLSGTIYKSPIFRLAEFFIEYWEIPISGIEEIFDNLDTGMDLITAMMGSVIGQTLIKAPNVNGNGGSNSALKLQKMQWLTSVYPTRMPRIRNRRWTLFYGVKAIVTEYFTRDAIHKYEREVIVL